MDAEKLLFLLLCFINLAILALAFSIIILAFASLPIPMWLQKFWGKLLEFLREVTK